MCRNCGAIVGAGETQCAVCGATSGTKTGSATGEPAPDKETIRFARAVLNRPYKFTIILLVANLFIFLLMWESSGLSGAALLQSFPDRVLIAYGAKLNYLIDRPYNQWWRFITPMFVHINVLHLLMNMFSLLILGPFVEKLYGSAKFVVFWVVTGIAGSVGSYLAVQPQLARGLFGTFIFHKMDVPAAGASGALFGLIGVLFVFGIKFRHELPEGFKRVFGTGMLPIIFINLFIGFIGRAFIGNAAHLGGLFAGAALALFLDYRRPGARASITTAWRLLQFLCLAVILVAGYKVVRNFNRQPPVVARTPNAPSLIFLNYVNAMTQVQEKVSAVIHNNDLNDVPQVTQRAMQAPVPDARAAELRHSLLLILSKVANAAASATPENGPRQPHLEQKLIEEYDEWRKQYDEWLKSASKTYTAQL